jgi:hypothetical protein
MRQHLRERWWPNEAGRLSALIGRNLDAWVTD